VFQIGGVNCASGVAWVVTSFVFLQKVLAFGPYFTSFFAIWVPFLGPYF
jgi:hypothetical protein